MSKQLWYGLTLLALVMAVVCGPAAVPAQADRGSGGNSGPGNGGAQEIRIEGTVTAVGASSVTINATVVPVGAATKIERNGVRVPLSAIRVGDRGQARILAGAAVASRVESVGP